RVNAGSSTGSLTLNNSMRAHFSSYGGSTAGLKTMELGQRLFLRMNLVQQDKKDQLILYVNQEASNAFDAFDGEKMMQTSGLQCYTKVGAKNLVINGLNATKLTQTVPIIIEVPTTGLCTLAIENLEIDNGLVWLEDTQENFIQNLDSGTVYPFYADAGLHSERFVLHFELISPEVFGNAHDLVSAADFCEKGPRVYAEAAGVVVIDVSETTQSITAIDIKDASGKVVYTGELTDLQTKIQLQQANGIYYVSVTTEDGIAVHKVFVQQ
ncbi:MAG: hypothetical protein RL078_1718, partial [Bacteroidota bacterium]